jgi:hypothetical protein
MGFDFSNSMMSPCVRKDVASIDHPQKGAFEVAMSYYSAALKEDIVQKVLLTDGRPLNQISSRSRNIRLNSPLLGHMSSKKIRRVSVG